MGTASLPSSDPHLPTGMSPGDLDVFIRFDFPYPNVVCGSQRETGSSPIRLGSG